MPLAPILFRIGLIEVRRVRAQLWELLGQLEELSPATSSVMQLLAHLYTPPTKDVVKAEQKPVLPIIKVEPKKEEGGEEEEEEDWEEVEDGDMTAALAKHSTAQLGGGSADDPTSTAALWMAASSGADDDLLRLVPRLWLFLRHSLVSVRLATTQCLQRLLSAVNSDPFGGSSWLPPLLPALLLLVFQVRGSLHLSPRPDLPLTMIGPASSYHCRETHGVEGHGPLGTLKISASKQSCTPPPPSSAVLRTCSSRLTSVSSNALQASGRCSCPAASHPASQWPPPGHWFRRLSR